jgi:cyclopropane-fatty-acyl-phospholipid synthase
MAAGRLIERFERQLKDRGLPLEIVLWNGTTLRGAAPRVRLTLRSPRVLASLVNPTMGKLGRHYVEGEMDIDGSPREIIAVGELLSDSEQVLRGRAVRRFFHHSRHADRKAISYHYDLSDDFYALWLDRRRVYSCAYFRREEDTLDAAQEQKLDHICRKLRLAPGERLLDIGCGWGALAIWAAQHYGVHAVGITLSENQYNHGQQLVRELGLGDRVEIRLQDYRDVPEREPFDKISSIGMFEHVGKANLPVYFAKINRLLRPGGITLNHGITLNLLDRLELGSGIGQFVEDYVFPGGQLMHVSHVIAEMSRQGLEAWDVENLRPHYAKTLWHWGDRLEASREEAIRLVGEKRFRIWRIYLAGSAHGFDRGWMSLHQILAGKPVAGGALGFPLTRDFIYIP